VLKKAGHPADGAPPRLRSMQEHAQQPHGDSRTLKLAAVPI
jgi:hypothetical protein